ncbi:MAG TPA: hypothetical protein VN612_11770 [Acidobacteriaceae bacterium]|nr:hypothetical protein [Acidobacteriaceae bacterium]
MKDGNSDARGASRRQFLGMSVPAMAMAAGSNLLAQTGGGVAVTRQGAGSRSGTGAGSGPASGTDKFVAIQIGGRSFVDEGVDACLHTLQETGGVNVVMATVFTYGTGLAGRQVRGEPLPDHGVKEYERIHGGSFAKVHPEFYADSPIKDIRAPELGEFDVLADVIPKAKANGMKTYGLFEENYNPRLIPNFGEVAEVDLYGRTGGTTCFNNPGARAFLGAMVSDWVTNNDIDGIMWESERQGPLNNTIGASFNRIFPRRSGTANCFCEHCVRKAKEVGIDGVRAREGYIALDHWVSRTQAGPNPPDGNFVGLWRLFLEFPEIFAWERFWYASQEEMYAHIYGTAKAINPRLKVGWHIMHVVTMSPFYSADANYARLVPFSDYLKPCPYNNCAGPRMAQYIRNVQSTVFRDMTPQQVLDMHYAFFGYTGEASLDQLPTAGLSGATVGIETKRAIADVQGAIPIYPGIDIDVPTGLDEKRTTPEDVYAATLSALNAGAPGVVLSRKYAEMKLTNIAGAKRALKEFAAKQSGGHG